MRPPARATGRPRDPDIDAAVLHATRELLVEQGYTALTFGAVAARAGSTRPALYRRWSSKAHLVYDAVFPSEPLDALPRDTTFREHLRTLTERIVTSYSRPLAREAVPFLLAEIRDPQRRSSIVDRLLQQARADLAGRAAAAVVAGELRPDIDSDLLLELVHATALQHALSPTGDGAAPFADRLVSLVLAGAALRGLHGAGAGAGARAPRFHHRTVRVDDGTNIAYRIGGRGTPALLFVHGWCSNLTHWAAQLEHFSPRHRVLAVDRRGHGRSDVPAGGYTPTRHADDLATVARAAGVRDAVVVAHAGGGPAALALADRHPGLVRSLVLVDTNVSGRSALGRPRTAGRSPLGRLVDHISGRAGAERFEAMYRGFFSEHAGEVGEAAVRDALAVPLPVARKELASLAADSEGPARRFRGPVLWLTVAPPDEARLRSIFSDVHFGVTVGSGHFPHLEVPDQVNAMIERHLVRIGAVADDPARPTRRNTPSR
jgi:pimeloyl-ACP methyl ester carboxylesterase/AcrR family transcriptional regulator